jgi:tetratricopeptide (TPR) repeat protein
MPEVAERAQAYESTITLPTYAIKGANRNPVFRSQYGVAHIYPYTLLEDIETRPSARTYHSLILENQYLRVTVIPDLGGRVYSVFDKVSQREVFYKNTVVRFAPLAIRGAFFSGGVEFSFPVAHSPTTCDKVNWNLRENSDGSASVSVGGLEHISRLRWTITLTLYPDRCALAQDVFLFNPGAVPGRYHYWTNASLDANDGTEFIYPLQRARSYEFGGTASWPAARLDLIQADPGLPGMEGVPMWPASRLQAPVNLRWQKNMLAQVSIFGRDVEWDYFGAWQHKVDQGYAHVAKSDDVSGMKLWSWGNAPVGVVNQTALTDDGSVYAETQCGAMETQLDFDFLPPGGARDWREWWIPLRGMGGLTCASETIGARMTLAPVEGSELVTLLVALCPAKEYENAAITVAVPGTTLMEATFSTSPQKPWIGEVKVPAVEIADRPIHLMLRDSQGQTILENIQSREPRAVEPDTPLETASQQTADDFYKLGLRHENFDNRAEAREAYTRAVQIDPNHKEAHFRYGLMALRSAQLEEADQHFARAAQLGLSESHYYRGLIACFLGHWIEAREHFQLGQSSESYAPACLVGLGKLAIRQRKWEEAVGTLKQACQQAAGAVAPTTLLAIALRHGGRREEAAAELRQILRGDPLNHPALRELALANLPESAEAGRQLQRCLADDDAYAIDLGCYYLDAGMPQEAIDVLQAAWSQNANTMTAYLLAYLCHQTADAGAESAWLEKARKASPEFGFPSRLEEVAALESAIDRNAEDPNARYFLANFYYAHERYDEAIELWQDVSTRMEPYDVLFRNLGLAAWQHGHNLDDATSWFEKALALNPLNQDLYLHLDDLYKMQHLDEKRERLLTDIRALAEPREDVRKRSITMMVDLGHFQEALDVMTTETFIPLEMDQSFHDVFVRALLMRAAAHLDGGRVEEAIEDYQRALRYPANLGVGAPTTRVQANIYYQLGLAHEKLGQYREAITAWREAAQEHHPHGQELFGYIQMALDKLSRYSEMGLEA